MAIDSIHTQTGFISAIAEIILNQPEDAEDLLNRLTNINDGWLQGREERQANCDLIEAAYSTLEGY